MRLEALVSTGIAWEHVLREEQVRGTAVGAASSGNAVIKPTSISRDEQLRLMRQQWEKICVALGASS